MASEVVTSGRQPRFAGRVLKVSVFVKNSGNVVQIADVGVGRDGVEIVEME